MAEAASRRGADAIRNGKRLVGAVEEFDGHEDHFLVAEIFQIVNFELSEPVGLMASLAGLVGVFNGRTILQVLPPAPARHRRPEIIEHVAMEPDALAGGKTDDPDPDAIALRN